MKIKAVHHFSKGFDAQPFVFSSVYFVWFGEWGFVEGVMGDREVSGLCSAANFGFLMRIEAQLRAATPQALRASSPSRGAKILRASIPGDSHSHAAKAAVRCSPSRGAFGTQLYKKEPPSRFLVPITYSTIFPLSSPSIQKLCILLEDTQLFAWKMMFRYIWKKLSYLQPSNALRTLLAEAWS